MLIKFPYHIIYMQIFEFKFHYNNIMVYYPSFNSGILKILKLSITEKPLILNIGSDSKQFF